MSQTNRKFSLNFVSEMTGSNRIVTLILLAGIGIIMLVWPNTTLQFAVCIAGVVLMFLGAWYLFSWFRGGRLGNKEPVVIGAVLALIGLFLLVSPRFVITMVNVVAGILLILYGYITLSGALASRGGASKQWIISAVIGAATLVFGIVCLFSHNAADLIVRGVGIALIINVVSLFFSTKQ